MNDNEEPNVHFVSVAVESRIKQHFKTFGARGTRWQATVYLNLQDETRKRKVAEWFYLIVMSPEYYAKKYPTGSSLPYILQMPVFDLAKVELEARRRFDMVMPKSWDDFYAQMSKYFWNEDDEAES